MSFFQCFNSSCLRTVDDDDLTGHPFPVKQAVNGGSFVEPKQQHVDRDSTASNGDIKVTNGWDSMMKTMAECMESGAISVKSTCDEVGQKIYHGAQVTNEEMCNFFTGLTSSGKIAHVRVPSASSMQSDSTDTTDASFYNEPPQHGVPMVDYRSYPLKGYVDIPQALVSLLKMTCMDHYLVIGRPTMAPSAGLTGYKEVTTKEERQAAPFIIVIDKPGMLESYTDNKYIWVEFALGDTFMLDVSKMKGIDDYMKVLSKKGRWNYKDRQKKFHNNSNLKFEYIPFPAHKDFLDTLWPLYQQTGEKNGFTVLTEEEFYRFHLNVPDLVISMASDVSNPDNPKIISFCTGVRWKDVIMPMWCGTDYSNDLNKTCSTYFNILYSYVQKAIEDPDINWVDLGASHRKAKMAIGFSPYPSSGYFRCKNTFMQAIVESMMSTYYKPERLINDP